jgi:hypothetical protein
MLSGPYFRLALLAGLLLEHDRKRLRGFGAVFGRGCVAVALSRRNKQAGRGGANTLQEPGMILACLRFLKLQEDTKCIFIVTDRCSQRPDRLDKRRCRRPARAYMSREIVASPPNGITRAALVGNLTHRVRGNRSSDMA